MRLSKIRLNGFKSFVDPTPVPFPGGITAIVGPNGCGKSNIIDAVRWVMGESSAKHLRGGSMADVIFSGSGSRKPVGQASIELIFDNSDGSLGGQYAAFNEISVRRQVNRDGQSAYYLNGTRCRRRDITDVFLGTGLGPRSYSIIEQGTISRLIEAKPEELRGYLEEAAGISLYKERRRETERRMRDTRENLERLEDVRDEVGRQLDKLARQAETAERYRKLKAEERQRRAELFMLRIRALEAEKAGLHQDLAERNTALEAKIAEQRGYEREMESLRAQSAEQSDQLNAIQGRYYQIGSDLARLEQKISHRREIRESSAQELERNIGALAEAEQALAEDRDKEKVLRERIETLTPEITAIEQRIAEAQASVNSAQQTVTEKRDALVALNEERRDAERLADIERSRIEQLEEREFEQQRRRERIGVELESLEGAQEAATQTLSAEIQALADEHARIEAQIEALKEQRLEAEKARDLAQQSLDEKRAAVVERKARRSSLETLQQEALGTDDEVAQWLDELQLDAANRLGEQLNVESGWESAVEVVLADALQAIAADDLASAGKSAGRLGHGQVMLYRQSDDAAPMAAARVDGGSPLADKVQGPALINELLAFVHAAEDDAAAMDLLARLPIGHSVVTREGRWLGHRWLRVQAQAEDAERGIIARAKMLETLAEEIGELEQTVAEQESQWATANDRLSELAQTLDQMSAQRGSVDRDLAAKRARLESEQTQQAARAARIEGLEQERDELAEQLHSGRAAVRESRDRLQAALDQAESTEQRREPLEAAVEQAVAALDAANQTLSAQRETRQDVALRLESAHTALQSMEEAISRLERQQAALVARNQSLQSALEDVADPDDQLEHERQALVSQRAAVEQELTEARRALEAIDAQLRALDQSRAAAEKEVGALREGAESARYREYEIDARLLTQREQLTALDVELGAIAENLPESATEEEWDKQLEQLDQRIRRLGPINLAAIDEHATLTERKGYLDEQQADLTEALETLQSAIQRIDRETRARFKNTFDKVNSGLQRLFPRLFGGGEAYLEMTDDDLLETGVTIMARPPGKRISNIHLLSGGEKALAAVSLVFAIFELNPAPFCMLDEVDAPLDEANVGRFCDLLRDMSSRVQFIVITHNKTTMEAASHLAGVTMAEPGVSRLVAVDVAAAVELAGAEA